MAFLSSIFKKKPKKKAAQCSICKSHMEFDEGFALTTSQVIASKKYWDHKMVEPETMSYTTAHFKNKDENATNMRKIIFEKTAEKDHTWLVCETCINHFEVDRQATSELASGWWISQNGYELPGSGNAKEHMDSNDYESIKEYATMEAGSTLIRI